MKLIKKIFKCFSILIGVLSILLIGLLIYKSIPKEDYYAASNVQLKDPRFLDNFKSPTKNIYPAMAHFLVEGKSLGLIYRYYEDTIVLAIDDEIYKKVTIQIDESLLKNKTINLPNDKVIVLYSDGGSAWPDNGCHGNATTGEISLIKNIESYTAHLKLEFNTNKNFSWPDQKCDVITFDKKITFPLIEYKDLTPYLGAPAEHPYSATYR